MREALQAQRAGEHALMMTAETFNPASAKALVESMSGDEADDRTAGRRRPTRGPLMPGSAGGRVSAPERGRDEGRRQHGQHLDRGSGLLRSRQLRRGAVEPDVEVEISNPVDIPPPAGSGYDPATQRFTQVTATVFVNVRSTSDPNTPAQSVVAGRGRLTVGPITGAAAGY